MENFFKEDPKYIFSLTEKAIEFITTCKSEKKPFYLQISHYAVHTNIESKKKITISLKKKTRFT